MTSRPLTEGEIRLALSVFGPRGIFSSFGLPIDLSAIRVQTGEVPFLDSVGKMGFTPFGNINVSADSYSWDYSLGDKSTQRWFIHELEHSWEYQNDINVFGEAMPVQLGRLVRLFDGYDYGTLTDDSPFENFNVEQRASIVADYFGLKVLGIPPLHGDSSNILAVYEKVLGIEPRSDSPLPPHRPAEFGGEFRTQDPLRYAPDVLPGSLAGWLADLRGGASNGSLPYFATNPSWTLAEAPTGFAGLPNSALPTLPGSTLMPNLALDFGAPPYVRDFARQLNGYDAEVNGWADGINNWLADYSQVSDGYAAPGANSLETPVNYYAGFTGDGFQLGVNFGYQPSGSDSFNPLAYGGGSETGFGFNDLSELGSLVSGMWNDFTSLLSSVGSFFGNIFHSIATVRHQEMVANHICDLVTLAIGANSAEKESAIARGGRAARFYCLKQDVERFLFHQDLGAEFLARKNRITERYVHMLFELEGLTLSKYILGRRLLEAYRLLADPTGGRVSDIAFSVGFNDLSYFNRAFSKRFSAKPREVRSVFQTCCAQT